MRLLALVLGLALSAPFGCGESDPPGAPEDVDAAPGDDGGTEPPANGEETYLGAAYDVTIDPSTGVTTATVTATVRAGEQELASFAWVVDRGLTASAAEVDGASAAVDEAVAGPYRAFTIRPRDAVPAGDTVEVSVSYGGALVCESPAPLQGACDVDPGAMSRFHPGSVFPLFVTEPALPQRGPQSVVMRTPVDAEVVVSARQVESRTEGDTRVTTWEVDHGWTLGIAALIGTFASERLMEDPIPVVFHHAIGDDAWDDRLAEWIPRVVPSLHEIVDRPLPCTEIHLAKWPDHFTDAGRADICLIGLRDLHEQTGEFLFEEAWAHELAHFWWGGQVFPADYARQKLLTEGLATWTMYAYRYRQDPALDVDEYWGLRTRDVGLLLRYATPAARAAPVVASSPAQAITLDPHGFFETFTWEYLKTTATLDLLAVTIGDAAFRRGLARYLDDCSFSPCDTGDFRRSMEAAAGEELTPFFDAFVHASPDQTIAVGFVAEPAGATTGVDITIRRTGSPVPVPLELWVELASGERRVERITLVETETHLDVTVDDGVAAVRLNPRYDALFTVVSAIPGDVTFDGRADDTDASSCGALVGKTVEPVFPPGGGSSYLGIDVAFDPRCDLDGDGAISEGDVEAVRAATAP
jgi:hypothetical protein